MSMVLSEADDRRIATIEQTVKEISTAVNTLVTKHSVMEQRVSALEGQPAQAKSNWNLSLNGCATLAMSVSAFTGIIGLFVSIAALLVAILLR